MEKNGACRICGNGTGNTPYLVREHMFGTGEEFGYFECGRCGCLQIREMPADMSKYYPDRYYSYQNPDVFRKLASDAALLRYLRRARTMYLMGSFSIAGFLAALIFPPYPKLSMYIRWLKGCGADMKLKVLDVGCGAGGILSELLWYGFEDLTGIDPFIKEDTVFPGGLKIYKRDLFDEKGVYDLVMLNHSFEHMADELKALQHIRTLLAPDGRLLIRIPTVSSYAWQEYGVDWISIDAPRHFFIHSLTSIEILAKSAGFIIDEVEYDATDLQLWGSEQSRRGIPLYGKGSYALDPEKSIFSKKEMADIGRRSRELNRTRRGDAIAVYMRKG